MSMRSKQGFAAALLAVAMLVSAIVGASAVTQVDDTAGGEASSAATASVNEVKPPTPEDLEPVFLRSEADERAARALAKNINVSFADVPLEDVATCLTRDAGVEVVIDRKMLRDAGIDVDTKVTISLRHVSLRAALRIMLRRIGLTFVVRDGEIAITDASKAVFMPFMALHPVADLTTYCDLQGRPYEDYEGLSWPITSHCDPESWDAVGGSGTLKGFGGNLMVGQTSEVHDRIADFLRTLRLVRERQDAGEFTPLATDGANENTARVLKALEGKIDLDCSKTSLIELALITGEHAGINVLVDDQALIDAGIDTESTITGVAKDMPLRDALHKLLRGSNLDAVVRDEVLAITTEEVAARQLVTVVYPCADLCPNEYSLVGGADGTFGELVQVIESTIHPKSWDAVGGAGAIDDFAWYGVIVISQTREIHRDIAALLDNVRQLHRRQHAADEPREDDFETRVYGIWLVDTAGGTGVAGDAKEVAEVVRDLVEPQSWEEDGVYLRGLSNRLVVRHRRSVQAKVRKFIETLRWPEGLSAGNHGGGGVGTAF